MGYITQDVPFLSSPGPLISFNPIIPAVQAAVNGARAAGANIVVGLSHIGYQVDLQVSLLMLLHGFCQFNIPADTILVVSNM